MKTRSALASLLCCLAFSLNIYAQADPASYVDPKIGSEGLGRVFIGPSCPYGMVKPSPDCTSKPNSGWLPMPERVDGFAQVHVSGTGGGPKYGNILIQPFTGEPRSEVWAHRKWEKIELGYYATEFEENSIKTEITTAERASVYRISYPDALGGYLRVDCGFFLGENPVPKAREAQQFVRSECRVEDSTTVVGSQSLSGGWNNGGEYTVYFCLKSDVPFASSESFRTPEGKSGADLKLEAKEANIRIGISFLSIDKARENLSTVLDKDFDSVRRECLDSWNSILSRVEISPKKNFNSFSSEQYLRMYYTGLYHTMLMPACRTGELEGCEGVYYDDYYAIWDTYRTSTPLITLLDPDRERDIVNSLLNIYKMDGYMPDARSGNSNGRTQGGSNAEIVIADAFVKGLQGIDYNLALQAMIKDAEVPPCDDEAHGRGGLEEYNTLGYIPWGIPRAGNRTVEYSLCDYAIATLARGLGEDEIADKYLKRSSNWKNLWRQDLEMDGVRGFIMPRDAEGNWLDSLTFGHSLLRSPKYLYTPTTFEGPWYTKWWSSFFYEASSWEYSLSIPHDVEGLKQMCGGEQAFRSRLDRFFDGGYYNVNNEPSFLSPCLYHWTDSPEMSSKRVLEIIRNHFGSSPLGLPGNDDSGAMSSWLCFHLSGLYPLAGESVYLIHTPSVKKTVFNLPNGKTFTIEARGLSDRRTRVVSATLNGKKIKDFRLSHEDILNGGKLVLKMGRMKGAAASKTHTEEEKQGVEEISGERVLEKLRMTCSLHGQTRRYDVDLFRSGSTLVFKWGIERNLHYQKGEYRMGSKALEEASKLSFSMPIDGNTEILDDASLFAVFPTRSLEELKQRGRCRFSYTDWALVDSLDMALGLPLIHARDLNEGAQVWILDNPELPLVWKMSSNPLEVDWTFSSQDPQRVRILSEPELTGGIYRSYPESGIDLSPLDVPRGYSLCYISHYGRHGSRYLTEDSRYKTLLDLLEEQNRGRNLTSEGLSLLSDMRSLWPKVSGRGGELSEIGRQQHSGIARRMFDRGAAFMNGARVYARSSTSGRCIESMEAFCGTLSSLDSSLSIEKNSDEANMAVLAYNSPEVKAYGSEDAPWRKGEWQQFRNRNVRPERLMRSLFKNPSLIRDPRTLMEQIYWVAVGMQDIPSDEDFIRYFTPEELFSVWRTVNYRMYKINADCPDNSSVGLQSARSLLEDIISRADSALSGEGPGLDLRFGHDTNLLRLLALMGVEGADAQSTDGENFWRVWQEFELSPMAANLQLYFVRGKKASDVKVKLLLNERPARISSLPDEDGYVDWNELKNHWYKRINQ